MDWKDIGDRPIGLSEWTTLNLMAKRLRLEGFIGLAIETQIVAELMKHLERKAKKLSLAWRAVDHGDRGNISKKELNGILHQIAERI